ncbi:MAG: CBS domain-containing protein [Novosphingobium sp.]
MTIRRLIAGREGDIWSCRTTDSVRDAVAKLAERRIGALPVVDDDERVAGIFSERDVLYCLAKRGAEMLELKVGEVMTAPAVSVEPDTRVHEALALMTRRRFRHLPVVQEERMVGFVSIGDLVKWRIDLIQSEAEAMRNYIQSA